MGFIIAYGELEGSAVSLGDQDLFHFSRPFQGPLQACAFVYPGRGGFFTDVNSGRSASIDASVIYGDLLRRDSFFREGEIPPLVSVLEAFFSLDFFDDCIKFSRALSETYCSPGTLVPCMEFPDYSLIVFDDSHVVERDQFRDFVLNSGREFV